VNPLQTLHALPLATVVVEGLDLAAEQQKVSADRLTAVDCPHTDLLPLPSQSRKNRLTSILSNGRNNCLLVGAGESLGRFQVDNDLVKRESHKAHSHELIQVLFAPNFKQLVSVDVSALVVVWELSSLAAHAAAHLTPKGWEGEIGKVVLRFHVHERGAIVSSAALDRLARRLITGTHSGAVKIHNFNNGALLYSFASREQEVSQLIR